MCVCVSCPTTGPDHGVCTYCVSIRGTNRSFIFSFFVKNKWSVWYESNTPVFRVRMYGITVCIHRRPRPIRARECMHACMHARRMDAMGFMHSSVVDARGDGRERRTNREDRHRTHRTSLSRLSRVFIDRFERRIHFIHSFIPLRTKGRTNRGTRSRETRPTRDARDATIDASVRIARGERGTHVSNARRIERIESLIMHACMHFKRPTGDDRAQLQ